MTARIYTKTGDRGETGLFSGQRVPKDHPRVRAYGHLDELMSQLGVMRAFCKDQNICKMVLSVQEDILVISTELSTTAEAGARLERRISASDADRLEGLIDELTAVFAMPGKFILPGACRASALAHVARAVCRRCERSAVSLDREVGGLRWICRYLNRLSDLLFVQAWALEQQSEMFALLGVEG